MTEAIRTFACFGSECAVIVAGPGSLGSPAQAAALVEARLLELHEQFTRFDPGSELSAVNADVRDTVEVSPLMARLAEAVRSAATASGGLVDGTLASEIERAGYASHFDSEPLALATALSLAPPRRPAGPHPQARWRTIEVDRRAGLLTRPAGVRLDAGGIAKGLFADVLGGALAGHGSFAIDCGGDVRFGGVEEIHRPVLVESPFDGSVLHRFERAGGAVATSGIGRRSWLDPGGRPAHHLLDPSTGRPAFTGIVQVTAFAPTAVEAEMRSKAALLSGPRAVASWLRHGGVVVYDDTRSRVITPAAGGTPRRRPGSESGLRASRGSATRERWPSSRP
ncbi:MAG TPA: FAD:protein FMN transferase [Solirubrobacteraceae bacterium]|nr:FAD:protein FMN transferase [Solirubrobacteraceae bacterium]